MGCLMGNLKDKYDKLKDGYGKINKYNNKQIYNDCARIIVGFKMVGHIVLKLPKAIEQKKKDETNTNENSFYKNESVFDYLEEPGFEFNEEVERISEKIEQKMDSDNNEIKKFRERTSILYWIKIVIIKIKNRNQKMLGEWSKEEQTIDRKNKQEEKRHEFIEGLRNIGEIEGEQSSDDRGEVRKKREEKDDER